MTSSFPRTRSMATQNCEIFWTSNLSSRSRINTNVGHMNIRCVNFLVKYHFQELCDLRKTSTLTDTKVKGIHLPCGVIQNGVTAHCQRTLDFSHYRACHIRISRDHVLLKLRTILVWTVKAKPEMQRCGVLRRGRTRMFCTWSEFMNYLVERVSFHQQTTTITIMMVLASNRWPHPSLLTPQCWLRNMKFRFRSLIKPDMKNCSSICKTVRAISF